MNRKVSSLLIGICLAPFWSGSLQAEEVCTAFGGIVIQSEGRLKPLDTFARAQLLGIHEKSATRDQTALAWLTKVLMNSDAANALDIFRIRNDEVLAMNVLGKRLYHFICELPECCRHQHFFFIKATIANVPGSVDD